VALIRTDVSEERIASIFRVHECEQVTERSCKLLCRQRFVGYLAANPDCQEEIELLKRGLRTIGQLVHISPSENGNGRVWKELIMKAEAERIVLSKHLDGKALFTAVLRLYAETHRELRETLLPEGKDTPEEVCEQRRRKRNPSEDHAKKSKPSLRSVAYRQVSSAKRAR
jgi:hypothetical protein